MWPNSQCHADLVIFAEEIFNIKLLTFFVQRKDDQLFYLYFKSQSVNYPIHPCLQIYMCYGLDIFTRSASVYKMKIRKILNGLLV